MKASIHLKVNGHAQQLIIVEVETLPRVGEHLHIYEHGEYVVTAVTHNLLWEKANVPYTPYHIDAEAVSSGRATIAN